MLRPALALAAACPLMVVVTVASGAAPAQGAGSPPLVAYAFNEGSGTTAVNASAGGLNGTLTNGATWGVGRNAGAVVLDGVDDYVELGNPTALQITGSMTISAWINSAAFPVDDAAIVSKRTNANVGYQLDTTVDRGPRTIAFKLTNGSGGQVYRYGASTLQPNTWYHVTGVYNAATSELHVYLNGQLDDGALVGTVTTAQRNSTANVNIGHRGTNNKFNFVGRIDDTRIYNRALTLAEVQADAATPVAGAPGDTTPPTVAVSSPASNAQVSDVVNVTADASDDVGVAGVQLLVDGVDAGLEDVSAPYVFAWDSRTLANGAHTLTARARDAAGNSTVSSAIPVNVANTTTPSLPVAAYAFNEGSGTTAVNASGGGLNGMLMNGATWGAGRSAGAVVLDGVDDFVELGNPTSLQLTASMTVSAWINSAAFPVDDAAIVSKRSGANVGYQLDTTVDQGSRTIAFKLTTGSGGTMFRYGATTLQANTWYHVTGVYNAATSELHVYLNGQLDDGTLVGAVGSSQQNSTANVNIGQRPGTTQYNFNGRIDDVRLYNRALTQSEVAADAATPVGGDPSDPIPPTVSITSPTSNAQVFDIVNITADATDNVGVAGVQFSVDGVAAGVEDGVAPYAYAWDTRAVPNGAHTVTARARDAAGNVVVSAPIAVNVVNTSSFENEVLATGFNLPTNIEFLPDGRMLVVEFSGVIKVLPPPYLQPDPTPFLQLTNIADPGAAVDRGVIDLALDPQFSTNHFFYLFYTAATPTRDRLSRFTANATLTGTIAGSEVVLYQDSQDTTSASQSHHGGAIAFGDDGKIYFTTGDHFEGTPSQSLTSPRGKLHRINPDGSAPTDNPFYDGNGPNVDSIWALGLRNPYRMYFDAPTGRLYIGDVGGNDASNSQEEVDLAVRGANYGWPNVEGTTSNPLYTNPLYVYAHAGRDASITGGFVYHGTQFPAAYQGSYFFADYTQNWIRRITFDANGNVAGVSNFEPADGSVDGPYGDIVYLTEGPDGALYYVDIGYSDIGGTFGVSRIRRIRFISGNQAPVAVGAGNPASGPAPLDVNFSSAGSSDPEGAALTYSWTFGDGGTSTAANPTHTFAQPGQYVVRLTVSDGVNSTIAPPISIRVGSPPTATILSPTDGFVFVAGDVISYSGDGTDPDDGTLAASAFKWTIDFLHEGHVHPGAAITGVKSGTFTIPTSGHDFSGNTRYRITLTVTDSTGLTATRSVTIYPRKVNLAFSTVPAGLTLYLDGVAKATPFVYDTLAGFNHTVEARNQVLGSTNYTFGSWSDGGAQTHTIVVPGGDTSYAATFQAAAGPPPVAAYAFNEGSGTTSVNASGGGINGTLTNGATWGVGRNAGAVLLDGVNDYVELGNPTALQITGSMTISAWINPTAFPADDAAIVSKRTTGNTVGYQLDTTLDSGRRTIDFKFTNSSGGQVYRYGATTLQANNWYYVTGVYNSATSQLHVYLNGQLDDGALVGTVTATQRNSTANVNIGQRPTTTSYNFNGRIDDVRIYNRALTQAEIQADMNTPVA